MLKRFAPTLFFVAACIFGGSVLVHDIAHAPVAEAGAISGGSSGTASIATIGAGSSAQLFSALTDEIGVGSVVGSSGATLTNATLVTPNIGVATGDRLTLTSTSGTALTSTGQGTGVGGTFTAGASDAGGNNGTVAVRGSASTGNGGYFTGGGVYAGIWAENTGTGRAAVFLGDTTSPTRASVLMTPLDSNPSAVCAVGDLFVFTGGHLRMCAATTPLWEAVGSFFPTTTATAFAGGGQGSATIVCNQTPLTAITAVATAGDSLKFPSSATQGKICHLNNKTATSANLFPASGGSICVSGSACAATDAAVAIGANTAFICWHQGGAVWNCK